jgi:TolA-binding protein
MKKILVVLVAVFLCAGVSVSCSEKKQSAEKEKKVTSGDVEQKAKEAAETTVQYSTQKKNEYQRKIEGELREFNKKLDEMKEKAADLKGDAKSDFDRTMNELREKQSTAASEVEELKAKSGKAWEDLKAKTDEAVQDLKDAYDKAASRF